ncbi:hypothetical protein BJX64DRAFT_226320 [Aspergillus heterothallicus]
MRSSLHQSRVCKRHPSFLASLSAVLFIHRAQVCQIPRCVGVGVFPARRKESLMRPRDHQGATIVLLESQRSALEELSNPCTFTKSGDSLGAASANGIHGRIRLFCPCFHWPAQSLKLCMAWPSRV